jgi:16S rRNA processing protein RimM
MSLTAIAKLVGVFGLRGELKCVPTRAGEMALAAGRQYALDAGGGRMVRCAALRRHHTRWLVTLDGVATPDAAHEYIGATLYAERDALHLGEGEYLDSDLVGLRLCDPNGRELGAVVGVEHLPASDYLIVGPKRALVPLVRAFIRSIDVRAGTIVADLPEGLLDS